VVHSTTKYLNAHRHVGGVVISHDDEASERLSSSSERRRAVPGPFDCFLC